ncbi:alpha/beta fold hydrolase [Malonomonas rubra]|uniref:alpha/beta fold hydrolase n=1 Tax=Malonomonas rubra TaxID=57040 RepID=UPI0034E9719D
MLDTPLLKKEYPFESHFLPLNQLKYHYLDEGQGNPVVMLHGNPSWSFYYRNLVAELREQYRVIVPDHIGCGLSDKPADSLYAFTLKQRVDDLEALLEHLDIKSNITLVVHDWGGMIGMAFATRHPERIARLVILNTAAFHLPQSKPLPTALRICRDTQFGAFLVQGFNLFARGAAVVGCKRNPMKSDLRKAYCAPYDNWQHRVATLRFVQDIPLVEGDPGYDIVSEVQDNLQQFAELPICICWGEKDFVFDMHFLNEWRQRFPQAQVHSFADCGHYILEDAKEDVIPIIRKFLTENPLRTQGS